MKRQLMALGVGALLVLGGCSAQQVEAQPSPTATTVTPTTTAPTTKAPESPSPATKTAPRTITPTRTREAASVAPVKPTATVKAKRTSDGYEGILPALAAECKKDGWGPARCRAAALRIQQEQDAAIKKGIKDALPKVDTTEKDSYDRQEKAGVPIEEQDSNHNGIPDDVEEAD